MIFSLHSWFAAKFFPIFLIKKVVCMGLIINSILSFNVISINVCIINSKRAVRIETTDKI